MVKSAIQGDLVSGRGSLVEAHPSTAQSAQIHNVTIEKMLVTPQLARQWLSESINANNRTLKKTQVATLVSEIRRGAWRANGDPIRFGPDGILYDGQHRLAAIVAANVPLWCLIERGLPPEARLVIDAITLKRTAADAIEISKGGVSVAGSWRKHTAIITVIVRLHENNNRRVTPSELLEWYEKFQKGIDWAARLPGGRTGLAFSPAAAGLALAYCKEPAAVHEFAERAQYGDGLERGSPILVFREAVLARDRRSLPSLYQREFALKTLRAVQAYIQGESLTQLKVTDSGFKFFVGK